MAILLTQSAIDRIKNYTDKSEQSGVLFLSESSEPKSKQDIIIKLVNNNISILIFASLIVICRIRKKI